MTPQQQRDMDSLRRAKESLERQLAGQSGADVLGKEAIEREHRCSVPDP